MRLIAAALIAALSTLPAGAAELPAPLAQYAGKVVYLDFWASWCGPCAQSFPWLNQMHDKYGKDLTIVGINVDTEAGAADKFLQRHPARFDIVRDPKGTLPELYKIGGMPSSVLIDPSGKVVHQHSGFRTADTAGYEAAIKAALSSQEARQ